MSASDILTRTEISRELATLTDFTHAFGALRAVYRCPTSAAAVALFADIAALAEDQNHHPEVDWRYDTLFVTLTSVDSIRQVSARDVALGRGVSELAARVGAIAHLELVSVVEIGLDTQDHAAIEGVWKSALGYESAADGSIYDPYGRGPSLWFQESPTPNVNRFHLDVAVPYNQSPQALAQLELLGAYLDDHAAPAFVIATDTQGNRLCICTEEGRGD